MVILHFNQRPSAATQDFCFLFFICADFKYFREDLLYKLRCFPMCGYSCIALKWDKLEAEWGGRGLCLSLAK